MDATLYGALSTVVSMSRLSIVVSVQMKDVSIAVLTSSHRFVLRLRVGGDFPSSSSWLYVLQMSVVVARPPFLSVFRDF